MNKGGGSLKKGGGILWVACKNNLYPDAPSRYPDVICLVGGQVCYFSYFDNFPQVIQRYG